MPQANLSGVPPFYHKYMSRVTQDHLSDSFLEHQPELLNFFQTIAEEKWEYRYAAGKWSIKEVVQHLIDAERIFCYRAVCIARLEKASLPGFDENVYAAASKADRRTRDSLLNEYAVVQQGTRALFNSFDEEQLSASGTANGNPIYVAAIGCIIIGHTLHHRQIIQERYL